MTRFVPPSDNAVAADLARDLFAGLGEITVRKMFGGAGIYAEGVMFGLIAYGVLYLKAGLGDEERFREVGSRPFVWYSPSRDREITMAYWTLPEGALDDREEAEGWGRRALAAAHVAAAKRPPRKGKLTLTLT